MIPTYLVAVHLLLVGPGGADPATDPTCPPSGMTRANLLELKAAKFAVASSDRRNVLATELLACLDDPDPTIRDGVVFEGISTWLRGKALLPTTVLTLEESLRKTLAGKSDAGGFRLPFAALLLSEVVRVDRIEPLFSESVRESLVELAASSLTRVSDYRGFDDLEGWRHGVAHGSDLVLQLALNPQVGADGLRLMMEAIASQVAPHGPVFYTFGEPDRLARAALFACRRGLLNPSFWEGWIERIADPRPLSDWAAAFQSEAGLAKRHNTIAFLRALSSAGRTGGDEAGRTLSDLADKAATRVMEG